MVTMRKFIFILAALGSFARAQCIPPDDCTLYGMNCHLVNHRGRIIPLPGTEPQINGAPLHFRDFTPAGRTWWWLPKYPGDEYCSYVFARGGWRPYKFSAKGLPAGLHINPESGLISGTVKAAPGVYHMTFYVSDLDKNVASVSAQIQICKPKSKCDGFGN